MNSYWKNIEFPDFGGISNPQYLQDIENGQKLKLFSRLQYPFNNGITTDYIGYFFINAFHVQYGNYKNYTRSFFIHDYDKPKDLRIGKEEIDR